MWQDLADVLKQIHAYYTQLFNLSGKKRTALVMVNLQTLEQLIKQEDDLVAKIRQAETRRQDLLRQLSQQHPEIRPEAQMKEIYAYAPAALRPVLEQLHAELNDVLAHIKDAGGQNELLISGALSAVRYQLNRLGQSVVEPAYGTHGQEVVSRQKKFDFQA